MKFLDWLMRTLSPSPASMLDDTDFGLIQYRNGMWDGEHVAFAPVSEPVEVSIKGNESGPSQAAREAFRELAARYDSLKASIASYLQEDYLIAYPERVDARPTEVVDAFKLVGMSVGFDRGIPLNDNDFILTFECCWRSELLIDVWIENWIAVKAEGYD